MTVNRVEKLTKFLAKDPHNAFARYGLAMEYRSQGDLPKAADLFDQLLKGHPDYTPAFLHFGTLLLEMGKTDEAIQVFKDGIHLCTEKGEEHAKEELVLALRQADPSQPIE
jgi:Tfp pilus assembly protein PilF